jgi:hypothetical protein
VSPCSKFSRACRFRIIRPLFRHLSEPRPLLRFVRCSPCNQATTRDARVGIDRTADLRGGEGAYLVTIVSRAARHRAKVGPVGAHPSVRGHYSNAGRLSSGKPPPLYPISANVTSAASSDSVIRHNAGGRHRIGSAAPAEIVDAAHRSKVCRLARTASQHGDEQKFGDRVGRWKHLPRPVVLDLECWSLVTDKRQCEAIITRRHVGRRHEPIVAGHRGGVRTWLDREGHA